MNIILKNNYSMPLFISLVFAFYKLSSAQAMERGLPLPENDFGSRWVTVGYYDNAKEIAHFLPRALGRKTELQETFQN